MQPHVQDFMEAASRCPICFKPPQPTIEPSVVPDQREKDVVLRCPKGHPYVALGPTMGQAIELWNANIAFRQQEVHCLQDQMLSMLSLCKNCLKYTHSIVHFDKADATEQCADCFLTKSVKETE